MYAGLSKEQIRDLQQQICDAGGCTEAGVAAMSDKDFLEIVVYPMGQILLLQEQLKDAEKRSKNAGNWRTGLMAGATANRCTAVHLLSAVEPPSSLVQIRQHIKTKKHT